MLEVRNITKKYGANTAVRNLSFTIKPGKIYGLLGPNGAGKSTTMNIITGCLAATSGTVKINGHDIYAEPLEAKRHIGYLPEIPPLYTDMTPYEFLMFVVEAKGVCPEIGVRQVREVMDLTQLNPVADRLIRNLSKGYRQRVGIAQAMLGNPDLIILDEPTVGLDPLQIIEIRDLIRRLGSIKTVILSSHILAEVSEICDHIMIISHGELVADDSIENLENSSGSKHKLRVVWREGEGVRERLSALEGGSLLSVTKRGGETTAELECSQDLRESVFRAVVEGGGILLELQPQRLTLEDVFMQVTTDSYISREPDDKPAAEDAPAPESADNADDARQPLSKESAPVSRSRKKVPSDDENYKPLFSGGADGDADENEKEEK